MPRYKIPRLKSLSSFEKIKNNPISLGNDSSLDKDLKALRIGGVISPLEISEDEVRFSKHLECLSSADITGLLEVGGGEIKIGIHSIRMLGESDTSFYLQSATDIVLDPCSPRYGGEVPSSATILFRGAEYSGSNTMAGAFNSIPSSDLTVFYIIGGGKLNTLSSDYVYIAAGDNSVTTFGTNDDSGSGGHITLAPNGDLILDPTTQKTIINATDALYFDGGTHTYIKESSDDILDFYVGTDKMLALDEANDKITMGATNWVAGTVSGATVTEFSAANSAYAGMILGFTDIGLNETHVTLNLTTSYVVPTDEFSVAFTAPPSGNVLIEAQIQHYNGSTGLGDLYAGLSDANATSGYNQLAAHHESIVNDAQGRAAVDVVDISWTLTGLTAGTDYEYWAGFKAQSTTGTPRLQWGGSTTGRYADFIMKAIALPATITT